MHRPLLSLAALLTGSALLSALALTPAQSGALGAPPVPTQNPITPEKAVLGKILYWEEQLSSDNSVSCGTCHVPSLGLTDGRSERHPGQLPNEPADDLFTSPGIIRRNVDLHMTPDATFDLSPQLTPRRTNDFIGALYQDEIFWDGRADDVFIDPETGLVSIPSGGALENQALQPILSEIEMGHEGRTWDDVRLKLETAVPMRLATDLTPDIVAALAADPTYPDLFDNAFGTPDITAERIGYAIATYERTLVPDQTPWDDFMNGNPAAMTQDQIEGWNQFNGVANCHLCHTPPVFSDGDFHNTGLRHWSADLGREGVTGDIADRAAFKTPSLRGSGLRTSYFHTGGAPTFQQVRSVYDAGGGLFVQFLDPLLVPLAGNPNVEWLKIFDFIGEALTDPRMAAELPPFDRPTLYSERVPSRSNVFGNSAAGTSQAIPVISGVEQPAFPGNDRFELGVFRALSNTPGALFISLNKGPGPSPGGIPFNVEQPFNQVHWRLLAGTGVDDGWAAVPVPIPNTSTVIGRTFYAQWIVLDAGSPNGFGAASKGAEFTIQP